MLILVSHLVDRPVVTFDEAEALGVIRDPIIDPANGKVVGYFLGHGFLGMKQDVITSGDIVGFDKNRVIVQKEEAIRSAEDEPRIREILNKKIAVYGANVLTESGKHLGKATDLLLDTELGMIVKYYVHGMLQDRIVPAEHVITIEKRGIIVDDTAPSASAVAAEAETS